MFRVIVYLLGYGPDYLEATHLWTPPFPTVSCDFQKHSMTLRGPVEPSHPADRVGISNS